MIQLRSWYSRAFILLFFSPLVLQAGESPAPSGSSASKIPPELKDAVVTEKLGNTLSLDQIRFTNEDGQEVALSTFFKSGKPVLLQMVYFECPSLCSLVLNEFVSNAKGMDWTIGNQYEVVTVSIDPTEDSELAREKKKAYLAEYGRPGAETGWHFLTGREEQIKTLASQVGFGYRYDETSKEYAHSAVLIALTPEGKISRYLHGVNFPPSKMKLALLEASNGKVGSFIDQIILFCYRYDAHSRGYSLAVMRIMQIAALVTVLLVSGYLLLFWRRQRALHAPRI